MKFLIFLFAFVRPFYSHNIQSERNVTVIQPIDEQLTNETTFFGYNLRFKNQSKGSFSLIVGAPKTKATAIGGGVHSCPVLKQVTPLLNANCFSYPSPQFVQGNSTSSGLSLEVRSNQEVLACYPSKIFLCSQTTQIVPGFCFRTNNNGVEWRQLRKDNSSFCPKGSNKLDLIFVLDGSYSIKRSEFRAIKQWVNTVSNNFDITDGLTEIGVMTFYSKYNSSTKENIPVIKVNIKLGEIRNQQAFQRKVDEIRHFQGGTFTAQALNRAVLEFQKSSRFSSPDTSKVLVLLTDGKSEPGENVEEAANLVRLNKIKTIAVGVGTEINEAELRIIASGGSTEKNVYYVDNFDALKNFSSSVGNAINDLVLEGSTSSSFRHNQVEFGEAGFSMKKIEVKIDRPSYFFKFDKKLGIT